MAMTTTNTTTMTMTMTPFRIVCLLLLAILTTCMLTIVVGRTPLERFSSPPTTSPPLAYPIVSTASQNTDTICDVMNTGQKKCALYTFNQPSHFTAPVESRAFDAQGPVYVCKDAACSPHRISPSEFNSLTDIVNDTSGKGTRQLVTEALVDTGERPGHSGGISTKRDELVAAMETTRKKIDAQNELAREVHQKIRRKTWSIWKTRCSGTPFEYNTWSTFIDTPAYKALDPRKQICYQAAWL
jgi:hypothetical protein